MALDESNLSISADVIRYSEQLSPEFARDVERDARTLFTGEGLIAAQAERALLRRYREWWDAPDF